MTPRVLLILALAMALPGCLGEFGVDPSLRAHSKAEPTARHVAPVLPEQVRSDNAHQIAASLWDEIDREAIKSTVNR